MKIIYLTKIPYRNIVINSFKDISFKYKKCYIYINCVIYNLHMTTILGL